MITAHEREAVETAVFNAFVYGGNDFQPIDVNTYVEPIDNNEFGDEDYRRTGIRVHQIDFSTHETKVKDYELGDYLRIGVAELMYWGGKEFIDWMIDDILCDFYGYEKPCLTAEDLEYLPF